MEAELARLLFISLSLVAAAVLGFAAHRASLCSVKAVAEILSAHRAYLLMSLVKAILLELSNALLVILWGSWSYTNTLHQGVSTYFSWEWDQ